MSPSTVLPCRSLKILEQWRLKAALHSTNAVFIELGNDFTYALKEDSHLMYDNYKVLIANNLLLELIDIIIYLF